METKSVIIARHIESDKYWERSFNSKEEAIEFKNALAHRIDDKHEIIGLIKEKRTGHRWCLIIKNPKKDWEKEVMFFNSKKNCVLAGKLIKYSNNNLKITYTKKY